MPTAATHLWAFPPLTWTAGERCAVLSFVAFLFDKCMRGAARTRPSITDVNPFTPTLRRAATITRPRKSPSNPNDCMPPAIPISTSRNGSCAASPTNAGERADCQRQTAKSSQPQGREQRIAVASGGRSCRRCAAFYRSGTRQLSQLRSKERIPPRYFTALLPMDCSACGGSYGSLQSDRCRCLGRPRREQELLIQLPTPVEARGIHGLSLAGTGPRQQANGLCRSTLEVTFEAGATL
jgi:hypothetical protein